MGLGISTILHATVTDEDEKTVLLASWTPIKKGERFYWSEGQCLGDDIYCPNLLNLKFGETVPVELVRSENETGLWLVCEDGDFIGELWLYTYKPRFIDDINGLKKLDYKYMKTQKDTDMNCCFGLHINVIHLSGFRELESGEGPYPVTLKIMNGCTIEKL